MHKFIVVVAIFFTIRLTAQELPKVDSVLQLEGVIVTGYISNQPLLETPTSVGIVTGSSLRRQVDGSLLPAINSIPGVRMEERSPGSYRLSVRGSLLRSPWGVRDVKVYLDEFPLTDAGGNTYLNLIDPRTIQRMEVLKGPHGSLFGANSGGVVLIDQTGQPQDTASLKAAISGGSYRSVHQNLSVLLRFNDSQFNLAQGFQRSDGYRENAALRRHYVQASELWNYNAKNELKVLAFYANLDYQTPGGLNQAQYEEDPRQARPAAGPNPGAVEQKAGIRNQTFFSGITHEATFSENVRHVASVFGSHTDFENPFITNYEVRDETNFGVRTYMELMGSRNASWKWNVGLEIQRSDHDITNYDNTGNATRGAVQASDRIVTNQHFYFTRFSANVTNRLTAEAAVSLNYYRYRFEDLVSGSGLEGTRNFSPEWMPHFGLSYLMTRNFSWRGSVSRGYSPPTTAEIRPSNIVINTTLDAETGWNYETGFRFMNRNNRFQADASVFYYQMADAIVRRLDEGGNEFFINAGGTRQLGVESIITAWLIEPKQQGFIRGLMLSNSYTYSQFEFRDYIQGTENYTGNRLTGVPHYVVVSNLTLQLPQAFSIAAQHNYTDRIPLNDANSAYADGYHLMQVRVSWQKSTRDKQHFEVFARVDNLLNEKYSLGNDINAFGNRFYNAAPLRNFSVGLTYTL